MIISREARRYAQAIYETVPGTDADAFIRDAVDVRHTVESSKELQAFLTSPVLTAEKKSAVLTELFHARISPFMMGVILFLVENHVEHLTAGIIEALEHLHHTRRGMQKVDFVSARELSAEQRTSLKSKLVSMTGKEILPAFSVEPALIGGIVVRVGDMVYDGSVARQLELLRLRFAVG